MAEGMISLLEIEIWRFSNHFARSDFP